jgi:hypothetical protein
MHEVINYYQNLDGHYGGKEYLRELGIPNFLNYEVNTTRKMSINNTA